MVLNRGVHAKLYFLRVHHHEFQFGGVLLVEQRGDIALCQFDTCLESLVCISYTVMLLVMLLDIVQYQQGLFACSRFNDNLLETAQ